MTKYGKIGLDCILFKILGTRILNPIYSFIPSEIWQNAPDNTNVAESYHANCNRDGKTLPLQAAILKAKNYDERQFISCDIHNHYGIAKSGKDHGVVARGKQSVSCYQIKFSKKSQLKRQTSNVQSKSKKVKV
ncbi:hypothetical protein C1645_815012 [Glomus cerebriforme]|uniref:Uncharacterized protein n=1 Tax=Glomus cerebriforme TaxID=658196 RepID=A0A397TEN7_9GLOM|nr:hypothetical protein C1645_815012 [Glomus cerebriforme]